MSDSATGGGSGFFFTRLREEVARASRHGLPLACVVFRMREPGGCGEELRDRLASAGTILTRRIVRDNDVVSFMGSGHFGIVANASRAGARVLAETVARELDALDFTLEGAEVAFEVAYGISALNDGKTARMLVEEARAALDIAYATHQIQGYS